MTTAAIYCRISQDREGTEVGVDNQESACREMLERAGITVTAVYVDNNRGASSRSRKTRPEFDRMLADAERGQFDLIASYSYSRLTRRPVEFERLIGLYETHGIEYRTVKSANTDLSTADGRAVARTIAAWDAAEAERTGERVAFAQKAKLARGEDLGGRRPFGFDGRNAETVVEAEAEMIRAAAQSVIEGGTLYGVAKLWDSSPFHPTGKAARWRTQTVRQILLRPRNVGRLVVKGVDYGRTLPAILDDDTYEQVVAILTDPARAPRRGPHAQKWTATGLVTCGVCGSNLSQATGGRATSYINFRCARNGHAVPEGTRHPIYQAGKLERDLATIALVRASEIAERIAAGTEDGDTAQESATIRSIRAQIGELTRQRSVVQQLALMPGADLSQVAVDVARLAAEIDAATSRLNTMLAGNERARALEVVRQFMLPTLQGDGSLVSLEHADDAWREMWDGLDTDERRSLLRGLVTTIELLPVDDARPGLRFRVDGVEWWERGRPEPDDVPEE